MSNSYVHLGTNNFIASDCFTIIVLHMTIKKLILNLILKYGTLANVHFTPGFTNGSLCLQSGPLLGPIQLGGLWLGPHQVCFYSNRGDWIQAHSLRGVYIVQLKKNIRWVFHRLIPAYFKLNILIMFGLINRGFGISPPIPLLHAVKALKKHFSI